MNFNDIHILSDDYLKRANILGILPFTAKCFLISLYDGNGKDTVYSLYKRTANHILNSMFEKLLNLANDMKLLKIIEKENQNDYYNRKIEPTFSGMWLGYKYRLSNTYQAVYSE